MRLSEQRLPILWTRPSGHIRRRQPPLRVRPPESAHCWPHSLLATLWMVARALSDHAEALLERLDGLRLALLDDAISDAALRKLADDINKKILYKQTLIR